MLRTVKKAFIAKLGIVIEESDECIFWLKFAKDEDLINDEDLNYVLTEAKTDCYFYCITNNCR